MKYYPYYSHYELFGIELEQRLLDELFEEGLIQKEIEIQGRKYLIYIDADKETKQNQLKSIRLYDDERKF